ncbi:butyrophilin subfamily 1 member A1-like [Carettochelys insculpta]|uniref:butyrophilin subfamily 1 member A1-like n=1 Tax=Carettochelys insculpta TaxID=44489 RepID=UPI003EB974E4
MRARSWPELHRSLASPSLPGFVLFFVNLQLRSLDSAQFTVVGSAQPITAFVGEDVVLPCHLFPPMSAEGMEVRWFLSEFSSPVHLYRNGKDDTESQMPAYAGRTEFLKEGIREGRVALRLRNVQPADEGQYRCYFQSASFYGDALLEMKVAALGSAPLIAMEGYQDGGIRVVCRSAGWYPEPQVFWRDLMGREVLPLSEITSQREHSLFETEASIVITETSNQDISCSIRNTLLQQEKEAMVSIADPLFPKGSPWLAILCTILVIQSCVIGFLIYYFKRKERKAAECRWIDCLKAAVKVTLDPDTANPCLVISPDGKRVRMESKHQDLPHSPERFTYSPCVLGHQGFTSGRHYWGVEVVSVGGWAVGVARASVRRQEGAVSLKPEDGVWAIERQSWGEYWALTNPMTPLSIRRKLQKIRVSLDCDAGLVEVFDADAVKPFYAFPPASFGGEKIFPFLRVGGGGTQLKLCP